MLTLGLLLALFVLLIEKPRFVEVGPDAGFEVSLLRIEDHLFDFGLVYWWQVFLLDHKVFGFEDGLLQVRNYLFDGNRGLLDLLYLHHVFLRLLLKLGGDLFFFIYDHLQKP